jgi:hypothetical protein
MAERRMFAKTIIDSDDFLDMPMSTQALYFHLAMRADDDGFLNNPKKIQRVIGASDDDFKILLTKQYILAFDSGVIVIRHWKIHNYIQSDRYRPTMFKDEREQLDFHCNKAYVYKMDTECIQDVSKADTQVRVRDRVRDRDSLELELSKDKPKRFVPPTPEEVTAYCEERKNGIDAQHFVDYYSANGWKVGKNPMKDWKAAVRYWERNGISKPKEQPKDTSYDLDEFEKLAGTLF